MKGYVYKLYAGADESIGWVLNDPIFGNFSTLGACVPNVREAVDVGDWVFAVSGRVPQKVPYIVGGFKVDEKISAIEAHIRFPSYRLNVGSNGQILGNVIVDEKGGHHPLDGHDNFNRRKENYLVGTESLYPKDADEIELVRGRTHAIMEKVLHKQSNSIFGLMSRWRRLDSDQVNTMLVEISQAIGAK